MQTKKLTLKYEAPRLQTYGKLQELTKGTVNSGTDNGTFKTPPF